MGNNQWQLIVLLDICIATLVVVSHGYILGGRAVGHTLLRVDDGPRRTLKVKRKRTAPTHSWVARCTVPYLGPGARSDTLGLLACRLVVIHMQSHTEGTSLENTRDRE